MPELLHPGVYTFEVGSGVRPIEGVSTSTAAFIGVTEKGPLPGGMLPNGKPARPDMVTSLTEYFRRYGEFRSDSFMTYAVRAFFENGGRRLYVVRIAPPNTVPNPNPNNIIPSVAASTKKLGSLLISAANEGAWGNQIWVRTTNSSDGDPTHFKLLVYYPNSKSESLVESFDNLTVQTPADPNPPNYVRSIINSRSEYIAVIADVTALPTMTSPVDKQNPFGPPKPDNPAQLEKGTDGSWGKGKADYIGSPATKGIVTGSGLYALDKITDVNLIAIPGRGDDPTVSKGMAYCKNRPLRDCFFIADLGSIENVNTARNVGATTDDGGAIQTAVDFSSKFTGKDSGDYGAIYYPWILSSDPIGVGPNPRILLPPSGFLAGIYARVDNSRGYFKAPAGTLDSGVAGAIATATTVSDTEQDRLNPIGVNVVRTAPAGGGIVVWGTRTIGNDSQWRYIPVRRTAIFLRVSIYYGIQWAVFEPNDEPLWAALRLNIRAFMLTQFRAGAFQGSKPDDAFFVKCDSTTTTQQDIDNGVVNILVGFAPLKPAEFVVLKLSQKVNQPAA
jgi:phage tail sheath protein FI